MQIRPELNNPDERAVVTLDNAREGRALVRDGMPFYSITRFRLLCSMSKEYPQEVQVGFDQLYPIAQRLAVVEHELRKTGDIVQRTTYENVGHTILDYLEEVVKANYIH